MTIADPYTAPLIQPWYAPDFSGYFSALVAAIMITGQRASATIDHLTVLGTAGDIYGTNMFNAIYYWGALLPEGWKDFFAQQIPLTGTFSTTNSVFNYMCSAVWLENLVNAKATFSYNTIINNPFPIGVEDVSSSTILLSSNQDSNVTYGCGINGLQSVYIPGLLPSTVYITDNDFQSYQGGIAVGLLDYGEADFGTPSTLNAVVSGNVFQTPSRTGYYPTWGYSVIASYYLKSVVVSQNTILGGGSAGVYVFGGPGVVSGNTILNSYDGVWLNSTNDVQVTGNVIKNSAQYGIAVTNGSSYNLIAYNVVKYSSVYDLYWDGTGTGNVWIGNQYRTSYPRWLG
jgi:parallel beta-helix repeat protein